MIYIDDTPEILKRAQDRANPYIVNEALSIDPSDNERMILCGLICEEAFVSISRCKVVDVQFHDLIHEETGMKVEVKSNIQQRLDFLRKGLVAYSLVTPAGMNRVREGIVITAYYAEVEKRTVITGWNYAVEFKANAVLKKKGSKQDLTSFRYKRDSWETNIRTQMNRVALRDGRLILRNSKV